MSDLIQLPPAVGLPDGMKLEICAELAETYQDPGWEFVTRARVLRLIHCILKDDGTVLRVGARSRMVRDLKQNHPKLWETVRPFLRADDYTCGNCKHWISQHPEHEYAGSEKRLHCDGTGQLLTPCTCTTFVFKML